MPEPYSPDFGNPADFLTCRDLFESRKEVEFHAKGAKHAKKEKYGKEGMKIASLGA